MPAWARLVLAFTRGPRGKVAPSLVRSSITHWYCSRQEDSVPGMGRGSAISSELRCPVKYDHTHWLPTRRRF